MLLTLGEAPRFPRNAGCGESLRAAELLFARLDEEVLADQDPVALKLVPLSELVRCSVEFSRDAE